MSELNRRDLLWALSAAATVAGASTAEAQHDAPSAAGSLGPARAFPLESSAVVKMPNGSERRQVFEGSLATGEYVSLHLSSVPAGTPAPAAHRIQHSEFIFVQTGTLEFLHDGATSRVGPGGVLYVAVGTNHAVSNAGSTTATYAVLAIGGDTRKP